MTVRKRIAVPVWPPPTSHMGGCDDETVNNDSPEEDRCPGMADELGIDPLNRNEPDTLVMGGGNDGTVNNDSPEEDRCPGMADESDIDPPKRNVPHTSPMGSVDDGTVNISDETNIGGGDDETANNVEARITGIAGTIDETDNKN
uniref:Uncharacterized protein n=1 Tax=Anopheles merus TaxID=30066 RepID=A0A182VK48_ANOME